MSRDFDTVFLLLMSTSETFSIPQFSSVAQSCPTLCNPMDWRLPCPSPTAIRVGHDMTTSQQQLITVQTDKMQRCVELCPASRQPDYPDSRPLGLLALPSSAWNPLLPAQFCLQTPPLLSVKPSLFLPLHLLCACSARKTLFLPLWQPSLPCTVLCPSPHREVCPAHSRCTGNTCCGDVEDRMHIWQRKAQNSLKPKQTQALLPSVRV